jgi:DNA-binding transcriptional ArsR family regulator
MTAVLLQPVDGDADVAALAAVIGEPARAKILLTLTDGRALPATVLAGEAGVAPSTASSHLACLLEAGLITCHPQGRHRYYRLAGPQVGELLEALARLSPPAPVRSLREGTRAAALRAARTCYDHLAGRLGVEIFGRMIARGDVVGGDGRHYLDQAVHDRFSAEGHDLAYRLTDSGEARLAEFGVRLPIATDGAVPLRYCVDWTEQQHHLSGAVGRALTARLLDLAWLRRAPRGRAVHLTDAGRSGLVEAGLLSAAADEFAGARRS